MNDYELQLLLLVQLNDHSQKMNSRCLTSWHCQWAPSNIMWKLIRCTDPYNSVSYCSLALFLSVPPCGCTLDGCCWNVSWPGGSFRVCCARKERGRSGGRSWDGKWLRFCLISPLKLWDNLRDKLQTHKDDTLTSQWLWRGHSLIPTENTCTYLPFI